jgi:hypothetical protein
MTTTLNIIRRHSPCTEGCTKLLKHLGKTQGDDEPLSLLTVLDSNGLDDAIWCLRTEPTPERIQRFALAIARRVEHLSPAAKACNDVTERYLNGQATKVELVAAEAAAEAAADEAELGCAQEAEEAAALTAEIAALPLHAGGYLARVGRLASMTAGAALSAASYDLAADDKERRAQAKIFRKVFV